MTYEGEEEADSVPPSNGAIGSETQSLQRSIGTVSPAPVAHPMTHEIWRVLIVGSESVLESALLAAIPDGDTEHHGLPCCFRSALGDCVSLPMGAIGSASQIAERIAHWERRRPAGYAL